jgi:hypothetical protein
MDDDIAFASFANGLPILGSDGLLAADHTKRAFKFPAVPLIAPPNLASTRIDE